MDVPWLQTKKKRDNQPVFNLFAGDPVSMFTVGKAKEGGLKSAIFALYLSDAMQDTMSPDQVDFEINSQRNRIMFDLHVDLVKTMDQATSPDRLRMPIFLGLEGGRLLNNSMGRLENLANKGIKYLGLTHNRNTEWADSATDSLCHGGLKHFGFEVVKKCNEFGVLIDVSHASDNTAHDALDHSNKPVIASHSGVRNLVKQSRNLSDSLITRIAESGGVICVPYAKRFIGHYKIVDHISYIAELVGVKHVGIGSDLDGAVLIPGFNSVSQWSNAVVPDLQAAGVSESDIALILGGNLARVLNG
jgi:membrane dipeptidase